MKFKIPKLAKIFTNVQIGVGVARVVMGGRHSGIFDRIDQGVEIGQKAKEIADLVKLSIKK